MNRYSGCTARAVALLADTFVHGKRTQGRGALHYQALSLVLSFVEAAWRAGAALGAFVLPPPARAGGWLLRHRQCDLNGRRVAASKTKPDSAMASRKIGLHPDLGIKAGKANRKSGR